MHRTDGGERAVLISNQQCPGYRWAGDYRPFQPGGAAEFIKAVEKPNTLCGKAIQTGQINDEWLVRQDEVLDVLADLVHVAGVDRASDGHHGCQVTTLRPHRGATAVERETGVPRRQVRCRV